MLTAMTSSNAEVLHERSGHVANPKQHNSLPNSSINCVCFPVRGLKVLERNLSVGWPTYSNLKQTYALLELIPKLDLCFSDSTKQLKIWSTI